MTDNQKLRANEKEEAGKNKSGAKRYNLVIPDPLFNEVQQLAEEEHTTVIDLLRRFIRLGLMISKISKTPDTALIIREGEKEREIIFFT